MKLSKPSFTPKFSSFANSLKNIKIFNMFRELVDNLSVNSLRKVRINYRLIASFLILSLLPILIVGTVSINRSSKAMEENVSRYSIEIAKQLGAQISSQLKVFSDTLLEVSVSSQVKNYVDSLNADSDMLKKMETSKELERYLLTKSMTSKIEEIGFIPDAADRGFGNKNVIVKDNQDGIYKKIMASDSKGEWIYMETSEKNESNPSSPTTELKVPVLFRSARNTLSAKNIGVIYLLPEKNTFTSLVTGIKLDEAGEGKVYVADSQNIIVGSSSSELMGEKVPGEITKKLDSEYFNNNASLAGYFQTNIDGKNCLVSYSIIEEYGWKLITTVPFANLMEKTKTIGTTVATLGVICFIFALLISYMVTRSVSMPLGQINNAVESLKQGDFTQQLNVRFKDEISVLSLNFNSMISNVREMIKDVKKITHEVVTGSEKIENHSMQSLSASEQIAEAIGEIAAGSSEQALESQKGKENIDMLAEKLNHVVKSTSSVQAATSKTRDLCENSMDVVNYLNTSARETNMAAETIVREINDLNNDMKQINNIMKVIFKIADQTNLLALNAAIEAARAGEAGKGFAVVADEVKKLAEQSKNASLSISDIITKIMKKTAQVVDAAHTASDYIQKQMGAVKQTDDAFKSIVSATEEIAEQLESMNEQIKSMDEIKNKAVASMESIAGISQSAAAATEEVNATTEEQIASANQLADLAKDLNDLASALEQSAIKFKV